MSVSDWLVLIVNTHREEMSVSDWLVLMVKTHRGKIRRSGGVMMRER